MLRVIKRKVEEEGLADKAGATTELKPSAQTPIVSHIPVPVSIASSAGRNSTTSSISSAQYHAFQPLSRHADDETFEGDSPASSNAPSQDISSIFKRRRSSVEEDDSCSRKRARLVSDVSEGEFSSSSSVPSRDHQPPISSRPSDSKPRLLALPRDSEVLSPLHVFVRQQIEVFEATEDDLKLPCPGRRIPIVLGQVGLRCIHCKDLKGKKPKRAVCYPSSVARVYNSVSDMKWSHLPICQGLPCELRARYEELKTETKAAAERESSKKGAASTAKYYHKGALSLGLEDRPGGIYLAKTDAKTSISIPEDSDQPVTTNRSDQSKGEDSRPVASESASSSEIRKHPSLADSPRPLSQQNAFRQVSHAVTNEANSGTETSPHDSKMICPPKISQSKNTAILASEEDEQYLPAIHCFVRRHVEIFEATEDDLKQPMPGRKKPIVLGQVGLRCIHCAFLAPKNRQKRAICYPPSVGGIYHAISNIKHDHFAKCKGLPKEAHEEFLQLRAASMRRASSSSLSSGGKTNGDSSRRVSNSTAQYYVDSALRMGLYDSDEGIRMQPKKEPRPPFAVPDGMAALMIAATDPHVRAAHERSKQQPFMHSRKSDESKIK